MITREKPLLPPGRPFIASARTLTGTVWSTFGQRSSTLVRNKFIVVEKGTNVQVAGRMCLLGLAQKYTPRVGLENAILYKAPALLFIKAPAGVEVKGSFQRLSRRIPGRINHANWWWILTASQMFKRTLYFSFTKYFPLRMAVSKKPRSCSLPSWRTRRSFSSETTVLEL